MDGRVFFRIFTFYIVFDDLPGAPNDRMFPNTSEVSQKVFSVLYKPVWLILSCPSLFGTLRRTLAVTKVLGGFFVSSEMLATLRGPV